MRSVSAAVALAAGMLSSACDGGSVPVEHETHDFEEAGELDLGTAPWRARRRMDADQLNDSIVRVTGGIAWDEWRGNPPTFRQNYFETYADTLGVPDYVNGTTEDLTASLLFEKFLDDAARAVCRRAVNRETADGGAAQDGDAIGLFAPVDVEDAAPAPADVRATLTSLLLRFHGRRLGVDDPQLQPWTDFYSRVAAAASEDEPERAWEAVCVVLITHPDFYTY